jgi:hypothetical protein
MADEQAEKPFSVVQQIIDSLVSDAERLRLAHARGWPIVESDATLQLAAEKVERFRVGLLRFARLSRNLKSRGKGQPDP